MVGCVVRKVVFCVVAFPFFAHADVTGTWDLQTFSCSSGAAFAPDQNTPDSATMTIDPTSASAEMGYSDQGCVVRIQPYTYSIVNDEIVPSNSVGTVEMDCGSGVSTSTVTLNNLHFQLNEPNLVLGLKMSGCPAGDHALGNFVRR